MISILFKFFKVIISMFGFLATAAAAISLIVTVWSSIEDRKTTYKQLEISRRQLQILEQSQINDRFFISR